jgi:hypothetical protein
MPGDVDGGVPHTGQRHEGGTHLTEFGPVAHENNSPVVGGRRDGPGLLSPRAPPGA